MLVITPHAWTPPFTGIFTQPQTHSMIALEAHTHNYYNSKCCHFLPLNTAIMFYFCSLKHILYYGLNRKMKTHIIEQITLQN